MKYFIKLALSFLFIIAPSLASCHVSDCDDKDFIELGSQYSCVGSFSCSNGIFGSGTLVDFGVPELAGRTIITCAHIFVDQEEGGQDIAFTIGDNTPRSGTFYIHPAFQEFYLQYDTIEHTSFDIGIFILNEPIDNIKPAALSLDMAYEQLLNTNLISVGFGATGHVLGRYQIIDGHKRASYARARLEDNPNEERGDKRSFGMDETGALINPFSVIRKKDSILTLTPYVHSKFIVPQNSLEMFCKPAGVARQGDSGGGCFDPKSGMLIGIILRGDRPRKPVEVVFEKNYFSVYLEKCIKDDCAVYQQALSDIKNDPEKLKEFQEQNEAPKDPFLIQADEIMKYITDQYPIESFYSNPITQSVDMEIVTLFFHRHWIMETIKNLVPSY